MYFKTGDQGRIGCNELNDYHLKAVSGRPVIMRVLNGIVHMFNGIVYYMFRSLREHEAFSIGYIIRTTMITDYMYRTHTVITDYRLMFGMRSKQRPKLTLIQPASSSTIVTRLTKSKL